MAINENMCELLNTIVGNHFRLGMEPQDMLETITWWYANACNTLNVMLPNNKAEDYAKAAKPEIRGDNDELGQQGQSADNAGRQADAPVA